MADIMARDPFDVLAQTRQMLSRMDEIVGRGFFGNGTEEGSLPLDIYETGDDLVVEAPLPGFHKEDVNVQLHQGVLSIVAQPPALPGDGYQYHYYRRERPWGSWTRRIALPGIVQEAEVRAEMKDGLLTLRIPIPSAAKPKQIQIAG